jgi:dTDP-4-amino-4,6-dideoxygalactose transaminase
MVPGVLEWRPAENLGVGMIPHSRPWIGVTERDAVDEVLRTNMFVGGNLSGRFGEVLAEGRGASFLFPSGRLAVRAALSALDLPSGAGVIVQTYVCDAVVWAIRAAGLTPVLCDTGPNWVATLETISAAMTPSCAAILLAPPFGLLQSAEPFRALGLPIIHDLCQASPAAVSKAPRDALGDLVALSFHPTKYICAAGGGAILDPRAAHGARLHLEESAIADIAPFSNIQVAMGLAQLARLPDFVARRDAILNLFLESLPKTVTKRLSAALDVNTGDLFRFVVDIGSRDFDQISLLFAEAGITARRGVDQLAHRISGLPDARFPNAVHCFDTTLSLPFYPALDEEDAQKIAATARQLL